LDYDQYSRASKRSEQASVTGKKKKKVKKVKKRPVSTNALPRDMPHFDPNKGGSNQYYMMRNML